MYINKRNLAIVDRIATAAAITYRYVAVAAVLCGHAAGITNERRSVF